MLHREGIYLWKGTYLYAKTCAITGKLDANKCNAAAKDTVAEQTEYNKVHTVHHASIFNATLGTNSVVHDLIPVLTRQDLQQPIANVLTIFQPIEIALTNVTSRKCHYNNNYLEYSEHGNDERIKISWWPAFVEVKPKTRRKLQ